MFEDTIYSPFGLRSDVIQYLAIDSVELDDHEFVWQTGYYRNFLLSVDYQEHKRVRYNFWDALGDVGGFHDGLVLLIRILLGPFAAHRFILDLISDSKLVPKDSRKK